MFNTYLELGFEHILDPNAYDHIIFIIALCAIFTIKDWKKLLVLVTAFTIGHSLTLALSTLNVINVNSTLVEILIPITIIITAIVNISISSITKSGIRFHYILALLFGLIHGMGFSNYFKALLGRSQEIIGPLFAFNVGVELGQLVIVVLFMAFSFIMHFALKLRQNIWKIFVSGIAFGIAIILLLEAIK